MWASSESNSVQWEGVVSDANEDAGGLVLNPTLRNGC